MKIGLFDVDSILPNLALMKISAYHKSIGDDVELALPIMLHTYDKVYASKVFKFQHENDSYIQYNNKNWDVGGSGVDIKKALPNYIDEVQPDYSLYGINYNIGFASRGCRLKCKFCVVPEKEGKISSKSTIKELLTNPKSTNLMLLDNDFFGNPNWRDVSDELIELGIKVNINQGINIRVITDEQAEKLVKFNYRDSEFKHKRIHCAWDNIKDEKVFVRGIEKAITAGIKPSHIMVYVLIGFNSTTEEDLYRVEKCRTLGIDPYVMPFDKFNRYQKDFARWVNHKAIFKTVKWEDYKKAK